MSVEDDDWATAVDIQEGLTKVEIQPTKPAGKSNEQDEFTTVALSFCWFLYWYNSSHTVMSKPQLKAIKASYEKYCVKN